jgi:hypothetical protein
MFKLQRCWTSITQHPNDPVVAASRRCDIECRRLTLPADIRWGDTSLQTILERQVYRETVVDLDNVIANAAVDNVDERWALVDGTAGTGKTVFVFYLM